MKLSESSCVYDFVEDTQDLFNIFGVVCDAFFSTLILLSPSALEVSPIHRLDEIPDILFPHSLFFKQRLKHLLFTESEGE